MKKNIIFSLLLMAGLGFQAFADNFTRKIGAFTGVELKLPADVVWTSGDPSFSMICPADIESKIEVVNEGNTLVIKTKPGNWNWNIGKEGIKIQLSSALLSSIRIDGSGDFYMKSMSNTPSFSYKINGSGDLKAQVTTGACEGEINGSGDVEMKGSATSYDLDINGSGDVKAVGFECKSVNVEIAGSGDATVYASESLEIKIAGSGDVQFAGNPKNLRQKVAGSGEIRKL
jgi:hypothetical protein